MNTIMEKLDADRIDIKIIKNAAKVIREGGLVAFPTETVYGLGADALNSAASERIYAAKGRPSDNPLIVHIAEPAKGKLIVDNVPEKAEKLMRKFWPGPLTMVFKQNGGVPRETTGGLDTVALRMPNHPIALSLIKESGGFIAAPSANSSGKPSPTSAEHVLLDLNGKIDMILDGGMVEIGIESTIVDFTEEIPSILRPGYITKEMIEQEINYVNEDFALKGKKENFTPKAPGMKYRHYAPKAELVIVSGIEKSVLERIHLLISEAERINKTVGIIASDETIGRYKRGIVRSIGARSNEDTIAGSLYGILREFDALNVDMIYSESFDTPRIGQAIMNRLLKAAGYHVIKV